MSTTETKAEDLEQNMQDLDTKEKPVKKTTAKKKAPKKVAKGNGAAKAAKKEVDPNLVTLKALCKELKLDPRVARRRLRTADLKAEGRWSWQKGSGALSKVQKILSAAEAE